MAENYFLASPAAVKGGQGVHWLRKGRYNTKTRCSVEHCTPHANGAWLSKLTE